MTELENHLEEIKSRITAYFDCEGARTFGNVRWDMVAVSHRDMQRYFLESHWVVDKYRTSEWHFYKLIPGRPTENEIRELAHGLEKALDELVSPGFHQMETHLIGIILTHRLPPAESVRRIETFRKRRNFWLGLKGWAILEMALVAIDDRQLVLRKSLRGLRDLLQLK